MKEIRSMAHLLDIAGSDHNMERNRDFTGQPHTLTGFRGTQMINNISLRDLRDCYLRAYIKAHPTQKFPNNEKIEPNYTLSVECNKGPLAAICENDLIGLKGTAQPMAVLTMLSIEIEKLMGTYPISRK